MDYLEEFPVLIIDDELHSDTAEGRSSREIVKELKKEDFPVIEALTARDGVHAFLSHPHVSCIIIDWELTPEPVDGMFTARDVITLIRERNPKVPIFLNTEKLAISAIPLSVISRIDGYIWKLEDTPGFIAGHIKRAAKNYLADVLPPFFQGLMDYVEEYRYSWHTPGHMGGVAFLKSAPGRIFYDFFGENALRADLSASVPDLGSLLEHSGVVGEAEKKAAEVFGADRTYFVTGGTSAANKIVWLSTVTPGDIVLVDRNCHASVMHAIIMTGAVPVYLIPARNEYGIIGPIHSSEFLPDVIERKIRDCPLVEDPASRTARMAVITNSTYDGICYSAERIEEQLRDAVPYLHFDEAWSGYAKFHPLYAGRFGMHRAETAGPTVFATQSTHKVLAAFSQGSMLHVRQGRGPVDHPRFNEAFMMFTSTSPQYTIIASLDVATRMMAGHSGKFLIEEAIEEAIVFRKKMVTVAEEIRAGPFPEENYWWFTVWQPDCIMDQEAEQPLGEADDLLLRDRAGCWLLDPHDAWHGFPGIEEGYAMLDPIKVTILTPGIRPGMGMEDRGIPAAIVTKYLRESGIVVEKTGYYSFLVLFTLGITRGKSGTLLAELFRFKALYDGNSPLEEVFPDLVRQHPARYAGRGLADLCREMHGYLRDKSITETIRSVYATLPEAAMTPAEAYRHLVRGDVTPVPVSELEGRTVAVMVVPYPPGIPVIMPGERCSSATRAIVDYLVSLQDFDTLFPGFESEIHGVDVVTEDGRRIFYVSCVGE
ncbi:Orn/Lys/Arg decarboxylase N-terminal domain-containing protein [Methanoculleus sp.]|uniref:Orn/Lys/Arg family decarboxylase n=2 Tax=Methanoculleus sp. TaxID=90427 RepID=UPI002616D549|nr:Orn/Lys/Arg decarboxylase N-terminal domain-containing protein [Methanoculleus sp.]MDD4315083.1 Orn/Lys/Arg decarboxylase N-terminal domain-containing protein [Methanoculleus sp.]